jgi:hypothetical protein
VITSAKIRIFCFTLIVCALAQPASATTFLYAFEVPESTIQSAFTSNIGANASLFAAWEVYIRPIQNADVCHNGITGAALSSYTLDSAGAPIPTGIDKWDADRNQKALSGLDAFFSIHFYFDNLDSKLALVTNNANVAGHSYTSPNTNSGTLTGEQMPATDKFKMFISSKHSTITGTVNFQMYATALQFTDTTATIVASKSVIKGPIEFQATGYAATPEPAAWYGIIGGLALIAARLGKRSR